MLTIGLDSRNNVRWRQVKHFPAVVAYQRRIGYGPLDAIFANTGALDADPKRYLRPAAQHMTDNPFVRLVCFFADWRESKHATDALDNGGFARAAPTNEYVQVRVEANAYAIEKPAFPAQGNQFHVFLGLEIPIGGIQSNARSGIEKRLPQSVDADFVHFDPAGGGPLVELVRSDDVLCINRGDCEAIFGGVGATVIGVFVLYDLAGVLRQVVNGTWDLNSQEILVLPSANPSLAP